MAEADQSEVSVTTPTACGPVSQRGAAGSRGAVRPGAARRAAPAFSSSFSGGGPPFRRGRESPLADPISRLQFAREEIDRVLHARLDQDNNVTLSDGANRITAGRCAGRRLRAYAKSSECVGVDAPTSPTES